VENILTLKQVLPLLIPIVGMLIPIVAIIYGVNAKMRREQLMHETIRQLVEKGQAIPPELLNGGRGLSEADDGPSTRKNTLLGGAVCVATGLGLMVMFFAMNSQSWLWAIGCLPLFVGVAMLVVWRMERKPVVG
jgi:hypothetical protein